MLTFLTKTVAKAIVQYIVYILVAVSFIGVAAWYFSEPPKPPNQSWFSGKPTKKETFVQKNITQPIQKNVVDPINRALVQPVKKKVKQAVGYTPKPKPTFWQRNGGFITMTVCETVAAFALGASIYAIHDTHTKKRISLFTARLMALGAATIFYLGSKAIFRWSFKRPANLSPATWQQRWFGENVKYGRLHTWWILNRDTVYTVADWIVKSILFALLLATFKTRLQSSKLGEYIMFSEKSGMQPTKRG